MLKTLDLYVVPTIFLTRELLCAHVRRFVKSLSIIRSGIGKDVHRTLVSTRQNREGITYILSTISEYLFLMTCSRIMNYESIECAEDR